MTLKRPKFTALLLSLRPQQWVKNILVFAGIAFTGRWNWADGRYALGAFLVFCALSSAGYLVNDVRDLESDRQHPQKRHRPLPAGEISVPVVLVLAALLTAGSLGGAWVLSRHEGALFFGLTAGTYAAVTLGYSFYFKSKVIVDVLTIAGLFVLRAVAGCVVIPVAISPWIVICTLLGALFLALCKRRHELLLLGENTPTRTVLREYSPQLLDQMIAIVCACTIMSYSLYTFTAEAVRQHAGEQPWLMLTIPFVIFGVFRYLYLVYRRDIGGNPELMFTDKQMILNILLWMLLVLIITRSRQL
ncbi:MAG TPA: decaprenyl-phosphate phosphoribosyltransferase [Armatimonadetes bacterium]|nr:decaprenyl-phosphate phosphoribosyltransferase [Armatimonadota bacterium]